MDRRLLQAMVRVTDFLAGSRKPRVGRGGDTVDAGAFSALEEAERQRQLTIKSELLAMKQFLLTTFRAHFPGCTFRWGELTTGDVKQTLYVDSGGAMFGAVRVEHWDEGDAEVGFWFHLRCNYGVVNGVMHADTAHHAVHFEEDDDDTCWKGEISFNGGIPDYEAEINVGGKQEAFTWLASFLVGEHAQGLYDPSEDSSDDSLSTASSPRTP